MSVATADSSEKIPDDVGYTPYGAAKELLTCRDEEVVISGCAESGKTLACLVRLDLLCRKYDDLKTLMVRKVKADLTDTAVRTFEDDVLQVWDMEAQEMVKDETVRKIGGEHPEKFVYPNGSRIVLAGMDKSSRVLSGEYDVIYVNQAEELDREDWETLATRATGRAGNLPWGGQIYGCANPGPPTHWILSRKEEGHLNLIHADLKDNPTLWDRDKEEWTEQGNRTISRLESLTGARYERLRHGRWVQAEGIVYEEYDQRTHIIRDPGHDLIGVKRGNLIRETGKRSAAAAVARKVRNGEWWAMRAVDWGYSHPAVVGWWAVDGDGRMFLYRQLYHTGMTVRELAKKVKQHSVDEAYRTTVTDHDPSAQRVFEEEGIYTEDATKAVETGVSVVKDRLRTAGDGWPRIFFCEGNLIKTDQSLAESSRPQRGEQEFDTYVWESEDKPRKENDDFCDMMRYACMYVDEYEHAAPQIGWIEV